jgi:hypothetical protein
VGIIMRFAVRYLARGLLAFLVLSVGCKAEKPAASVSGTVTYNGKPQTTGSVNFLSSTGSAGQAQLDESGGYKIDGPLDPGEYRVFLLAPIPGQYRPGTKAPPQPKFGVAAKFLNPASSGVKVVLKPGRNEVPIEMKE